MIRPVRAAVAAAAALLPLAAAAGCGRVVEGKAEGAIRDMLPRYVGPADKYAVDVGGKTSAMTRGRFRRVRIDGTNVRLTPQLTVAALGLDLTDVAVDPRAGRLEAVGAAGFSARIAEPELNRYVGDRRPGMRDLRVSCGTDGLLTVRARPEVLGYPTLPVQVRGTLRPREDGARLDFVPDSARVSVVPLPRFVVDHLVGRLNPVVDLSEGVALPVTVRSTSVQAGALTLTGVLPPDELLRAAVSGR